jgi:multiple sugar transport system permease protein
VTAVLPTVADADAVVRARPPARRDRALAAVAHHTLLIAAAVMFLAPMLFMFLTALMTDRQALTRRMWPHPFVWSNFTAVFHAAPLWHYAWNTSQIAVFSTIGTVVSCVPVAYALSRMRWRGRSTTLLVVMATYLLPAQATVIPLYALFAKIHWLGSMKPLIVPSFLGDAFSIFLLRQFFLTVPAELTDLARGEGASEWQVLRRVIVPLAAPAIGAVALFTFLFAWNDLFGPLLYLGENQRLWTLSLAMSEFRGVHAVQWNLTMAASVLVMTPVIVVFLLAQRVLLEGVAVTGRAR